MPSANTFAVKPIKEFVERNVKEAKIIVDPFANNCKYGTITNDLNPEYDTNYHLDALEFLKSLETESADVILYDPPYSLRQASECYKSFGKNKLKRGITNARYWSDCKKEVARVLKHSGYCLCFGWNSNGIGKCNGMELQEILLVAHGGSHNDTICTKEIKI